MQYVRKLKKGDKVAIVSWSSGMLGEEYHEIVSSDSWYEEREDFSRAAIGTDTKIHKGMCI